MSIAITNTMTFSKNPDDMNRMFEREKASRMEYSRKIKNKENTAEDFYSEEDV
jgi:hypothetical protein